MRADRGSGRGVGGGGQRLKRLLHLLAALAGAFGLAVAVPSASLAYSTGTIYPLITVDNGTGDQSQPHVSGNHAAYDITTSSGSDVIGFFDFSASSRSTIPIAANQSDALSDISGDNIVFTRLDTGASSIYKYAISSGTSSEVAPVTPPALPLRRNPAIGSSTIAWEDAGVSSASGQNPELVLTTGSGTTRVTNDSAADQNPNVSPAGDMVVWQKCSSGNCDVYAARLASGWSAVGAATTSASETSPDTNGTQIVYASDAGGAEHVYVTTLGGSPSQIPSATATQGNPAIAGNFVAYEGGNSTQHDIYVHDLSAGTTYQITNTPSDVETLSDITLSGTTVRLVWEVGGDVYGSEFTVATPQPPPQQFADQFLPPLAQSTDPANPVINTGKNGRVIPVQVQISQGATAITDQNAPGPVTIAVSKLASCSTTAGTDPITSYADAGQSSAGTNQFKYDPTAQAWTYNLDTKALGLVTGNCYRIDVSVNGTQITNAFAVYQPTK